MTALEELTTQRQRKLNVSALTMQLAAQELEAEGAASLAGSRVQPYVLCLHRGVEHVNLRATFVLVTQKLLEGKG